MNATGDNAAASMAAGTDMETDEQSILRDQEQAMRNEVDVLKNPTRGNDVADSGRDTVQRWNEFTKEFNDVTGPTYLLEHKEAIKKVLQQAPFSSVHFKDTLEFINSIPKATVDKSEVHFGSLVRQCLKIIPTLVASHLAVREALVYYASLSQTDSTSCTSVSGTKRKSSTMMKGSEDEKDIKDLPISIGHYAQRAPDLNSLSSFGVNTVRIGILEDIPESHKDVLKTFSNNLAHYFKEATKFEKSKSSVPKIDGENDKSDFLISLCVLEDALVTNTNDSSQTQDARESYVPAPSAPEKDIVQPFLMTLLQSLAAKIDCFEAFKDETRHVSPAKTTIQTNRVIPRLEFRPKRVVDKSMTSNGRYFYLLRDDLIEIPIKEKPGERASQSPDDLLKESRNQIVGHLAKHVGIGFNFKGVGVDTKATGIILTPAYVKILQLRLENVGKMDVKVRLLETPCMPLLQEDLFDQWIESSSHKQSWTNLGLYNKNTLPAKQEVPAGLVALYNVMTSSRSDLFGSPTFNSDSDLGEIIGFGAFATVHAHNNEESQVIKVSRYGAHAALDREAEALRDLSSGASRSTRIVQYVYHGKLNVTVNELKFEMPALFVKPKGKSAQASLAFAKKESVTNALHTIASDICDALSFIHSREYTHNDVSPKNILWDNKNNHYFLIDFGLATKFKDSVKGFRGTTRFAHREIFSNYPKKDWTGWEGRCEYDYSALAFSVAALSLSYNKEPLWKPFQPTVGKDGLNEWANDRSAKAWNALELLKFDEKKWKARCFDC